MEDVKRVYVAGKLNDMAVGYNYNRHKMLNTGELLREAGYAPYVPCLIEQMGIMFGWEKYSDYFNFSQPWLAVSDAVLLVEGWETSKGTIEEIQFALEHKIPVFDRLDELWSHFKGIPGGAIVGLTHESDGTVVGCIKERNVLPEEEMLYDASRT